MNSVQFKNEIDQYIDSSYKEFLSYQNVIKELFGVLHRICVENNIRYYSAFGTLLGLVRDKGMIPWDADIDVMISIDDAEQAIKTISDNLPEDYYMISNFINPNYYLYESRLCKKGYNADVFHVDIFYLIGAPEAESERRKYRKRIRKTFYLRALKFQPISKGDNKRDQLVYYTKKIIKAGLHLVPNSIFNYHCTKLMNKYNFEEATYLTSWDDLAAIYPASNFKEMKTVLIDNQEYCIPNDPDAILEAIYPEYKTYLPISSRYEEFYQWFKRFNKCEPENEKQ